MSMNIQLQAIKGKLKITYPNIHQTPSKITAKILASNIPLFVYLKWVRDRELINWDGDVDEFFYESEFKTLVNFIPTNSNFNFEEFLLDICFTEIEYYKTHMLDIVQWIQKFQEEEFELKWIEW